MPAIRNTKKTLVERLLLKQESMKNKSLLERIGMDPTSSTKLYNNITNGHLLFVMGALILQRVQKCEVRQVTKDVVKSEV